VAQRTNSSTRNNHTNVVFLQATSPCKQRTKGRSINTMNQEDGVSQVVIEDFVEKHLPLLMEIKDKVDAGETLSTADIEIMGRMIERTDDFGEFLGQHPQYKTLLAKITDLYNTITEKAVENEAKD
jgi:hypothetical protein